MSVFFILYNCQKVPKEMMVTTGEVSDTTSNSAKISGKIIDLGEGEIEIGQVYSKMANERYSWIRKKSSDPAIIGEFFSSLTGLDPNTKYYVKSYITNIKDTIYGKTISFTTFSESNILVQDGEGNSYKTVSINGQIWMAENLKTTKYRDGSDISNIINNKEWSELNSGASCYNETIPNYLKIYGRLYNWWVVDPKNPKKVCPVNWHVPNTNDWNILITFLGDNAGRKLKEEGIVHWSFQSQGTNEFGFSALPGGARDFKYGAFGGVGDSGGWWSSEEYIPPSAFYFTLPDNDFDIHQDVINEHYGFSVRCVKDN